MKGTQLFSWNSSVKYGVLGLWKNSKTTQKAYLNTEALVLKTAMQDTKVKTAWQQKKFLISFKETFWIFFFPYRYNYIQMLQGHAFSQILFQT